jgi:trk system potassium uptake protein
MDMTAPAELQGLFRFGPARFWRKIITMARKNHPQEFAVIGLGRFGSSVALTLMEHGCEVIGIDSDRALVQQYADRLTQTIALNATDEDALRAIDIASIDTVIVSMAEHFENSVLTTAALKSLGVRQVICKALTERQAEILKRIGAERVVLPEKEAGERLALEIVMPQLLDSMVLGQGNTIAEVQTPDWLIGRTLAQTRLRERKQVSVLLVKSDNDMLVPPPPDLVLQKGDLLVVIGSNKAVARFSD